jgi:starch synthase (maltosyl-transferring)
MTEKRHRPVAGPAHHPSAPAAPVPPRLLIERVTPELDAGRYAVKRCVGDRLEIGADVIKDGHDRVQARIRYRGPSHTSWKYAPMSYDYGTDRWYGAVALDAIGEWIYSVEAWEDTYGTWCDELQKKVEAGQEVSLELSEGALLLEAAALRATTAQHKTLADAAAFLRQPTALIADRVGRALSEPVQAAMDAHADHSLAAQYVRYLRVTVDRERARFGSWYEMFPRSQTASPSIHGTFKDAGRALPRLARLGFDVVYLPPVHPIGRTHRKGKNNSLVCEPGDPGSPWAIGSEAGGHTAVEPRLGTIDDFDRFVVAANKLGIEIALDYALQCSPDHPWVREHPEWFFIRPDGSIKYAENPPKKYQDIYPLNFWSADREGLWNACRDIFTFWIGHGVRIFRVDNPHTKPLAFWEWVIAEIRKDHPDVLFLSEAFTRPKRLQVLAKLGFTQSYTYFTWRNSAWELREYLTELTQTEVADYLRPNFFANTPDILHEFLQKGGPPAFRIRLVLAATLSATYGIYSGFELCENKPLKPGSEEYLDSEKYEIRVRDWEAPGNIDGDIELLNRIRRGNAALRLTNNISFHHSDNDRILFYEKSAPDGSNDLLIAVSLDPNSAQEATVHVPLDSLRLPSDRDFAVEDLLTGVVYTWRGERNYVRLDPGEQVAHVLRVVR